MRNRNLTLLVSLALSALPATTLAQKRPAPGDPKREIQIFDLADLVKDQKLGPDASEEARRAGAENNLKAVAAFIPVFIEPPLQKGEEVKSLGQGNLVVLGRPNQLAWVHGFLEQNRKEQPYLLEMETILMHVQPKTYKRLLEPIMKQKTDKHGKKVGPVHAMMKSGEKTERFLAEFQKDEGTAQITAPKLLCFPLQKASVSVANQVAYIKDYEFTRTDSPKAVIADPIVDVLQDGVAFEGTGAFVRKDTVGLSFKLRVGEVLRPIKTMQIPKKKLPPDLKNAKLTISLPEVTITTLTAKAEIPENGWGFFSMGRRHNRYWVLMIKTRAVRVK